MSVSVAALASALAAALLVNDARVAAGLAVLVGWPLACALDCVDGEIARQDDKASLAGAVLDAVADVGSFAATGVVLVVWLDATDTPLPVLAMCAVLVGITLWTSAPLGTVGFRATGQQRSRGKSTGLVRGTALRRALAASATLFDWSLVQVVFALLISWGPAHASSWAAAYVLGTGLVMFGARIFAFGRLDDWR